MNRMTAEMDTRGFSAIKYKTSVVEDITNDLHDELEELKEGITSCRRDYIIY